MGELLEALKGIKLPSIAQKVVDEADVLYSKRAETASYVDHLETKIKQLQTELENLRSEKGISSKSVGLKFDEATGTHVDSSTNLRYCTKCLISDEKRAPLKNDKHGWICPVCKTYFPDPSRPPPTRAVRGSTWRI